MRLLKSERDWFENEMRIKEAMTRMPTPVAPDVSIFHAKAIMNEKGVRHLPVLEQGAPVGVISDRDIRVAETFHGPGYLRVGDAMSQAPYIVDPETPISEILTEMIERKIGSALVMSPRGILIGIFTQYDALEILRALVLLGTREREPVAPSWTADRPSEEAA